MANKENLLSYMRIHLVLDWESKRKGGTKDTSVLPLNLQTCAERGLGSGSVTHPTLPVEEREAHW